MPETHSLRREIIGLALIALAIGMLGNSRWIEETGRFDASIHDRVVASRDRWPGLTALFRSATRFGNAEVAAPVTLGVAIGIILLARRGVTGLRASEAFVWLGTIVGGWYLSNVLKLVYHRQRPPLAGRLVREVSYSFPSTHSVFAAVFFLMLAILVVRSIPASRVGPRVLVGAVCAALAFVIGASRVWLGVHYPTDVIGGWLLGIGWVLAIGIIRRSLAEPGGRWEIGQRTDMIPPQARDRSPT